MKFITKHYHTVVRNRLELQSSIDLKCVLSLYPRCGNNSESGVHPQRLLA